MVFSDHYPLKTPISCFHLTAFETPLVMVGYYCCLCKVTERILQDERWLGCAVESVGQRVQQLKEPVQSISMAHNVLWTKRERFILLYFITTHKTMRVRKRHFKSYMEDAYNQEGYGWPNRMLKDHHNLNHKRA